MRRDGDCVLCGGDYTDDLREHHRSEHPLSDGFGRQPYDDAATLAASFVAGAVGALAGLALTAAIFTRLARRLLS